MVKNFLIVLFLFISFASVSQSKADRHLSKIETLIIDTISKLPEVKERIRHVDNKTKGKRHLSITVWSKPNQKEKYYWIKVMEDNGATYVSHFNFFVYPNNLTIKYFDTKNDTAISLKVWRSK
jgi:Na+-transporting NADH:ubiquinone oxidoreductase subunit NqrA